MRGGARRVAVCAAAIAFAAPAVADAAARRFALVVGNDDGGPDTVPLRYARSDAKKIAAVLRQLGGVASSDVVLLLDEDAAAVREALRDLSARIESGAGGGHTTLVVYYSGHAKDGDLRLGRSRLPMAELRQALADSAADLKLGILDACEAGAITREKGGRPGPSFIVDAQDLRPSRGLILITSSAEDESSQESDELGGSFFSHYLTSGLRGDADESGDRRVTLDEIYRYAYHKTVTQTAGTRSGVQHPTYSFDLKGNGHLVLTDLSMGRSGVVFGSSLEGDFMIFDLDREVVAAELHKAGGAERRIALPAGSYAIKKRLPDHLRMARFTLGEVGFYAVDEAAMDAVAFEDDYAKGSLHAPIELGGPFGAAVEAVLVYQSFLSSDARASLVPPHLLAGVQLQLEPILAARIGIELLFGGTEEHPLELAGLSIPYDFSEVQVALQAMWGLRGDHWSALAGPRLSAMYLSRTFPKDPDLAGHRQDHLALSPAVAAAFGYTFGELGSGLTAGARAELGVISFGVDQNRVLLYAQAGASVGYAF